MLQSGGLAVVLCHISDILGSMVLASRGFWSLDKHLVMLCYSPEGELSLISPYPHQLTLTDSARQKVLNFIDNTDMAHDSSVNVLKRNNSTLRIYEGCFI